jgi:type III restriction enzyme
VVKAGVPVKVREWIRIGPKTTTMRGKRYLSLRDYEEQVKAGILAVKEEERDSSGSLVRVRVESVKYIESDTALIQRVMGREAGGKQNILVMNDEAHHAYRIKHDEEEQEEIGDGDEDDDTDDDTDKEFFKEATVWVDGLDRVQKLRGINFCVDFSATPYFLGRVGQETNKPFPWVVSDFGLVDAIESGLVKIPQLAIRDTTGKEVPDYLNIWHWLMEKLTPAEKGGSKASPKPEAVLKWAHHPIAIMGGGWEKCREERAKDSVDPRPPVFILVCKNTKIAKTLYEWIAEGATWRDVAPANLASLRNRDGRINTIRVDSKVVKETDSGGAKSDKHRWMRFTLDTVGKLQWPQDLQGRPVYPEKFEDLAKKLERPLHPPGRDVRCIVSVGMLTEGWDCNTVTHIVGLRPFMSQLLCEQVVGRGLRRASYELGPNGKFTEEVAQILGVPFEVIPFKANPAGRATPQEKKHHVFAVPEKAEFEIRFPRVEGYTQAIRNRVTVNWDKAPPLRLEPGKIAPEVQLKGLSITTSGRPSLYGPGKISDADLKVHREQRRMQELVFQFARVLTETYIKDGKATVPAHALFPQLMQIVRRYVDEKVTAEPPADKKDLFLAPYWGWLIERLVEAIHPDTAEGETPEIPIYERMRGPGSTAEVSFSTSRDVREAIHSHLNYVVADTEKWEQSAAYYIDTHPDVFSFVKNDHLGFAIPYLHNGQPHDYRPDFIIRYKGDGERFLILETKGFDPLAEVKAAAAHRWAAAVNAEGSYGHWAYAMARKPTEVSGAISGRAHEPKC